MLTYHEKTNHAQPPTINVQKNNRNKFSTSVDLSLFFAQNPTFSPILSLFFILNGWDV